MGNILSFFGIGNETPVSKPKPQTEQKKQNPRYTPLPITKNQKVVGDMFRKLTPEVSDWVEDKDKGCFDRKNDGKISLKEGIEYGIKGFLFGAVKEVIKHPVATAVAVGVGVTLTAVTGGAALPVMAAVGAAASAATVGYGAYKVAAAKTDAEAQQGCETIGMGVFGLVTATLSSKNALDKAAEAGVVGAKRAEDATYVESLGQCFKTTPEALKVSGKYISEAVQSFKNSVKIATYNLTKSNASSAENFENEKMVLGYKVKRYIAKSTGLSGKGNRFKDPALQENLMKSINEDNVELAKDLITKHGMDCTRSSNYVVVREEYSDYILRSVPKVLQSTDPKVHEAARYIIECEDISDKFHAIKILSSSNAKEIMSLRPIKNQDGTVISIQQQLWEKFPIRVKPLRTLRYFASNDGVISGNRGNLFNIKIYGDKGKIPNVPGAYPEINPVTGKPDLNHFVIYEETSKNGDFWKAMDKALELIDKYGYKTE